VKRTALYMRVSTLDQNPQTQVHDLRAMAAQRGLKIVHEYTDHGISGTRARRPGLDQMMDDARHGRFDVVLVWAADRVARSVKHFLEVLDELNRLNVEFVSFRENLDTGGPLGRAVIIIVSTVAELERSLIVERVRAGVAPGSKAGTSDASRSTSTVTPCSANGPAAAVSPRSRRRSASRGQRSAGSSVSRHTRCRRRRPLPPTPPPSLYRLRAGRNRPLKRGSARTTVNATKQGAGNGALRWPTRCGF
jgi:DNA invertase Pin-like site-specific DNA recombinase